MSRTERFWFSIYGKAWVSPAHVGCDTSQWARTVHIDGLPINHAPFGSTGRRQRRHHDRGLADGDTLHLMQEAFRENHALQCGFYPMVMSAIGIVDRNQDELDEKTVRYELEGNSADAGYHNIVKAILAAHKDMTT